SALHPRTPEEGDSTDFAKALSQALSLLPAAAGDQPGVIFLLTDGKLDVSNDSAYGNTADQRNQAAQRQVGDLLRQARQRNIQVWPLGFGNNIAEDQLAAFAAGGSQQTCSPGSP